ncbi:MAG: 50S ribosomal protein L24 [Candidatus Aenigmarchaeota archaeon]|nr:50S ribosomal protein L24 [Candidatus Aenigmarchaeota archaeon]
MKVKSKKPNKQRKFLHNAPLHLRRKLLSAHLSKELRQEFKRRALPLRKGDEVEIVKGKYASKTGKIAKVDLNNYKVYIEGITRRRTVGTEVQVPIHPSNLEITNLSLNDEFRRKILQRKGIKVEKPKEMEDKKNVAPEKTVDTKILENTEKDKEMGSKS